MKERKFLGHIISKEGVKMNLERVEAIKVIDFPRNKQEVQSSLGKINVLRIFIPKFFEIVKEITIPRKWNEVRWSVSWNFLISNK